MPYRREKENSIHVFWSRGDGKRICKICRRRVSEAMKLLVTCVDTYGESYRTQVCEGCLIRELARDSFKWRSTYGKRILLLHSELGKRSRTDPEHWGKTSIL